MSSAKPPSSRRPTTAAEVAELAGVSRSAVSRTFTDGASVSPQTRAKVLKAAAKLNYHVNKLAQGLSKEESRPVCVLVSTLLKPYHARLLHEITVVLQKAKRVLIVINVGENPDAAAQALEQALQYRAAATIVLSGSPPTDLVRASVDAGQQVILVNRDEDLPGVQHIQIEYESAMRHAAELFLRAGCQRIALVSREDRTPSLDARESHFISAVRQLGIEPVVWRGPSTSYDTGQIAARELLSGRTPPDGIFCINDLMACGFLDVARLEFARRLPDDLCVLGFDNIIEADWSSYRLTTFAQPYQEISEAIADLLTQPERDTPTSIRLNARLVWRGTMRNAVT